MRNRIVGLTVLAAVLAIILFGIPLAIGVGRYYHSDEQAELLQLANATALDVADDAIHSRTPDSMPSVQAGSAVAFYSRTGILIAGHGPTRLDPELAAT